MRIIVTGAGGYIASTLIPCLLRDGHIVTGLDNLHLGGHGLLSYYSDPNFTFYKGSINDVPLVRLAMEGQDVAIHLAAIVGEPPCNKWPKEAERVNVDGTKIMLEEAQKAGVKHFLFSSTCSNYGRQPGSMLDETAPLVPLSLYAETKVRAERDVLAAHSTSMATTVFRFATAFGVSPRMRFDTLVNEFVRDAVVNAFLLVYGRDSFRTVVHVRDIVQMVRLTLEKRRECAGEVFNVGGMHISKGGLVNILRKYLPDLDVDFKEQQGDPRDYKASFAKAMRIGYRPQYTVEDGVIEVINALTDGLFADPNSSLYGNVR